MSDFLSNLKIEHWWHAFTVVGGIGSVAALAIPANPVASQRDIFLLFFSCFLFGVGSWMNHPVQNKIGMGFKITGYPRRASFLGCFFEILAALLFGLSLYRVVFFR